MLQLASSGASKPEAGPTPLHSRAKWLFRRHRTPRRPSTRPRVDTRTEREIESKVAWPREPEAGTLTACPPARGTRGTCPAAQGDGTKRAAGVTKGPPTDRPTDRRRKTLTLSLGRRDSSWCRGVLNLARAGGARQNCRPSRSRCTRQQGLVALDRPTVAPNFPPRAAVIGFCPAASLRGGGAGGVNGPTRHPTIVK